MKTKSILLLSLATNFVLLAALAYIQSVSIPESSPPVVFLINRANPDSLATTLKAVSGETAPR